MLALPFPLLAETLAAPTTDADMSLPAQVQSVLDRRRLPAQSLSVYVQDIDTGEVLQSWRANEPRNPASVMKLVTTLAALDSLGSAYTWKTDLHAVGEISGDTLHGDLLLKGYGDPFLVTERVWVMLRDLRRSGLRVITGDLLIDDSFFRIEDYDPGAFDRQPLRAYNVEPNAMMMNFKVVRYFFEPDIQRGSVNIGTDPELENLEILNRLSVAQGRCRGYQRGISINSSDEFNRMTFSGRFPSGCERYAITRTALGHNAFTYGLFKSIWQDVGGQFEGEWRNMQAALTEDAEPLLSFESWPLADVISRVNKYSNNVMARQLLLTLAAETFGAPGTEEMGRQAVAEWVTAKGLDADNLKLVNGSGLSRVGRLTAVQMAGLLRYAWHQPFMPEFVSSMSLAGLDGTTQRRFDESDPLTGRAHMKTGSLDDVNAIAGYLQARSGRRFVVVTLQNYKDVHRGSGEEVQEALMRWVYEQ